MWKKFVLFAALCSTAGAQTYGITTIAGGSGPGAGLSTTNYGLNRPWSVAADGSGNVYVAIPYWCQVWVVNSGGTLSQVIGNGACGSSGDNGSASSAMVQPSAVAVDSLGNIYIAEINRNRIRKVSGTTITTIAGTGSRGSGGDGGQAASAQLNSPTGVAVDSNFNIYIADNGNNKIRRVAAGTGVITTVAGTGAAGFSDNIAATSAQLNGPTGVAVDSSNNFYIADAQNNRVRKVTLATGSISTVAGNGTPGSGGDGGLATSAQLNLPVNEPSGGQGPNGIAVDTTGSLYIADTNNSKIRRVSGGVISSLPGSVNLPQGVAFGGGNVFVADTGNSRIGKVSGGSIVSVVGNGASAGGDGLGATNAQLAYPWNAATDGSSLYIADTYSCVVRKVSGGSITTVAGTGVCGYNGDGISATSAQLNNPSGVVTDGSGNLFIADFFNNRIRRVTNGTIMTVAGGGGSNADNIPATQASIVIPYGIALDNLGNLYLTDTAHYKVRKVDAITGIITTVAGTGTLGYNGDGITATTAQLNYPNGVAVDNNGNVYIADTDNQRIRKVSNGTITTVAGNGAIGFSGDNGSATSAQLSNPGGLAVDGTGNNIYIADSGNQRVRKVTGGMITTIAGSGGGGFSGDGGPATSAAISEPQSVTVDSGGNVYVADLTDNRIRLLTPGSGGNTCTYSLSPNVTLGAGASNGSLTVTTQSGCTWTAANNTPNVLTVTGVTSSTVSYNVLNNPNSGARNGSITITGTSFSQNFQVMQAGQGCQLGLTPPSITLPVTGTSSGSLTVNLSGVDCQWTSSTTVPSWVSITAGSSGTGTGTINYTVSSNASSSFTRGGAINVNVSTISAQAAFNITEAGATCSYSLQPSTQSFGPNGGPGAVSVVTQIGCPWAASNSNLPWAPLTPPATGTGPGTLNYTVQSNSSGTQRGGTFTIAGLPYVISQSSSAFSCAVSASSAPQVALEGRTEVLGDLLLNCTGLTSPITADISLMLNTSVTNKVTAGATDAALVNGSSTLNGQLLGYSTVHWPGVVLTPSGGNASVRITNVRADASLLETTSNVQAAAITGQLSVTSTIPVPLTNPSQTLANAVTTLAFQVGQPNPATGGARTLLPLSYVEMTATSFHTAVGSTPATRLRAVLSHIPSNVQVYAPASLAGNVSQAAQLYSADCSGQGGSPITGSAQPEGIYSQLTVTGGVATATWLVQSVDPANIDTLTSPLLLLNAGSSDLQAIQVVGSLAPVSPPSNACSGGDPAATAVPRYRDFSVPQALVHLRLTSSISATKTPPQAPPRIQPLAMQRRVGNIGAAAKPEARVNPQAVQSSVSVSFGASLSNESADQTLTNGSVSGSVPTGSNQMSCTASNGGSCNASGGAYSCSWSSVSPETTVSCSGDGQLDPSYQPGSTITNSAGASGDQPPADQTTTQSSSSVINPASLPTLQIDTPVSSTLVTGPVTVSGWAIDQASAIQQVQIWVDGNNVGNASLGGSRPDVCTVYAGWVGCPAGNVGYTFTINALSTGYHLITVVAIDSDAIPDAVTGAVSVSVPSGNYIVSGNVSGPNGGLSGVTVNVNGSQVMFTTTDGSGNYNFSLPQNGTYTLSAARVGYTFSPPFAIGSLTANQVLNFSGVPQTGLDFYPVTPCRVVDTRPAAGFPGAFGPPTMGPGTQRSFTIPSGSCGIPGTAAAYSLNVTVVPKGYLGYLSIWPTGQSLPVVSTLNSYNGTVVANAAIVPAGVAGAISVYVTDTTDVLLDINGYFAPPLPAGYMFYPVTPCRIADTRTGAGKTGSFGPPSLVPSVERSFPVQSGSCNIPTTATAYSLNFTVVPPGYLGYLTTWPTGQSWPNASTLNSYSGTVVANAAIVPAGTGGAISAYVPNPTDVLFDVNGYFAPPLANGLKFYAVTPCRVADTRAAAGKAAPFGPPTMGAGTIRTFPISSSTCSIPPSAAAYSVNVTVVPKGYLGYLTAWPAGLATPNVSTLNSYTGTVVANAAIVPAGTNGAISIYVTDISEVLFDINGYFAP